MEKKSWGKRVFGACLITIVVSLFFFPLQLSFLPMSLNTKMLLAGLGLIWYIFNLIAGRKPEISKKFFVCSLFAFLVSFIGLISILYNNTTDTTYASYIISMWVWMGGAYFCVCTIRVFHGSATVEHIINYLLAVCVMQCISAMLIEHIPAFKALVVRIISGFAGISSMKEVLEGDRIFGIGAYLDVAGSRFAAVLILTSFLLTQTDNDRICRWSPIYVLSYMFIAVIGNMIGRTTTVGIAVSMLVWGIALFKRKRITGNGWHIATWTLVILSGFIIATTILYNQDDVARKNIRFAFEGFFSLAEDGYWHTNSNDMLQHMYSFPDNAKTWIIGDGYFDSPEKNDPFFLGSNPTEYYKGTDVGYCRFIYYFGITGLLTFITFFIICGYYCGYNNRKYRPMFALLVLLNFIVWLKVSTDIFLVLALFLCLKTNGEDSELSINELECEE